MKLRGRDILLVIVAAITALVGCWSVISNIGTSTTGMGDLLPIWYLAVRNLMFVALGVWAVLRIIWQTRAASACNVLRIAVLILSGVFTVLVIIDASPLVSLFISQELWNDVTAMVNMVTYVFYLLIGMITFALCMKKRKKNGKCAVAWCDSGDRRGCQRVADRVLHLPIIRRKRHGIHSDHCLNGHTGDPASNHRIQCVRSS